jgi:eukaryotic-like serine/threonine-protein kinase
VLSKTEQEARDLLVGAGLKVKAEHRENDAPAGTVYDQDPKPEAKADKGSEVKIFVSKGPGQVSVPNVVGKSQDQATSDLEAAGLTVRPVPQASDTVAAGQVMAQDPAPGTKIDKGSAVTITVSSGTGQVTVPNVIGKDASDAANILGNAQFKTTTRTQPSDTVAAGLVISTTPGPGAKAPKGSTVALVVSSGPTTTTEAPTTSTSTTSGTTTVPNVVGDSRSVATTKLHARGFAVSASSCAMSSSIVTDQNPSGGTSAPTGSTVSIFCT